MISSDTSLRPGGANPSPAPVQSTSPSPRKYTGQSPRRQPRYIDINTTEDAAGNVLAQGIQQGDQRYQMKQFDRAGFSRGRSNQFMASQAGQQAIGQAASQAAQIRAEDQKTNAQMRADYENMREQEAMAMAMAGHSRNQANWSVNFARQQAAVDLLRRALLS